MLLLRVYLKFHSNSSYAFYYQSMSEKALKVSVHVIAWLVFFTLPFVLFPKMNIRLDILIMGMLPNVVLVAYFYTNLHVFVPRFLLKNKKLIFIVITVSSAIFISLLLPHPDMKHHINGQIRSEHFNTFRNQDMPPRPKFFLPFVSISFFLLVFILSTGIKLLEELFDARQKKQLAETAKSKAELAALKAQINPHFLFNTLNGIYSLSIEQSPKTSDAIMRLSGMMRYILTESESEYVPLSVEIDYLKQYIELQELRLTDKTNVAITIDGNFTGLNIAPLLLEPFVENAFKYGISTSDTSTIEININSKNSKILFSIQNRSFTIGVDTSKMGIQNVRQRLQLLYPNKHQLIITELNGFYNVELEINTL